ADAKLRAKTEKDRRDAARIRLGQFGEIAGPHHHFRIRQAPPRLNVASKRLRKPEMDRVKDRIGYKGKIAPLRLAGRADKRNEIAMRGRHKNRHCARSLREVEAALVEA